VLKLKQSGNRSITVGIDSVGGNLLATEQLLKILKAPNQDGQIPWILTVALNKTFSAAACLLALGDYAVAMPSAQVLFHDVRIGEVHDVTPTRAATAARELSRENDRVALLIAKSVAKRLAWNSIDLKRTYPEARKRIPELAKEVDALRAPQNLQADSPYFDLAGLICSIYEQTSPVGDRLIVKSVQHLTHWRKLEIAFESFKTINRPDTDAHALFRQSLG
jgi:hypothetical protein